MDYRIELEKAKRLNEQGQYLDANNICGELLNSIEINEDNDSIFKDAVLFTAKNYLWLIEDFEDEEDIDVVLKMMQVAMLRANSVKEIWDMYNGLCIEFERVKMHYIDIALVKAVKNSDNMREGYLVYTKAIKDLATFKLYLSAVKSNEKNYELLLQKENLTYEEACDKYNIDIPSDKDLLAQKCHVNALVIYKKLANYLEENARMNSSYVGEIVDALYAMTFNAKMFFEAALKDIDEENSFTVMTAYAEMIHGMLDAYIYPDGGRSSVFQGEVREEYMSKLEELYKKMQELNPDFVAPPMPEKEGIAYQPPVTTSSSGGCYVATAVYGSYDCPQVWTLRRFRDYTLDVSWYGRLFIKVYYAVSPTLVKWFGETNWFKNLWKKPLDKLVENLKNKGVEDTPYNDKY